MDNKTCNACDEEIEFIVKDVAWTEGLYDDEEYVDAEFALACDCSELPVVFGNISVGGPGAVLPDEWDDE